MKKPKRQTKKKEATICQRKRDSQDIAAMGCCQEPFINPGLYTLDNSPGAAVFSNELFTGHGVLTGMSNLTNIKTDILPETRRDMSRSYYALMMIVFMMRCLNAQTQIPESALRDVAAFGEYFSLHEIQTPFMVLYSEASDCGFCSQNLQMVIETVHERAIQHSMIIVVRASNERSARLMGETLNLNSELYFTNSGDLRTICGIESTPVFLFFGSGGVLENIIPLESTEEFMKWVDGIAADSKADGMVSLVSNPKQSYTTVRFDTLHLRDDEGSYPFFLRSQVHVMDKNGMIVTYDQKLHMVSVFDSTGFFKASYSFKEQLPDPSTAWAYYPSLGSDNERKVFLIYDHPADTTRQALLITVNLHDSSQSTQILTGNGAILALNDIVLPGMTSEEIVIAVMPRPVNGESVASGKDVARVYSRSGSIRASADISGEVNSSCIRPNQTQRPLIAKRGNTYLLLQTFSDTLFVLDAHLVPQRALPLEVPGGSVSADSGTRDVGPCVRSHKNIAMLCLPDGSILVERRIQAGNADIRHARSFTLYDQEGRTLFSGVTDLVFICSSESGFVYAVDPDASDKLFKITFQ
jgi:thioredoxin-related protein